MVNLGTGLVRQRNRRERLATARLTQARSQGVSWPYSFTQVTNRRGKRLTGSRGDGDTVPGGGSGREKFHLYGLPVSFLRETRAQWHVENDSATPTAGL